MWGKMLALLFKISTFSKLNLAKIGISNYKAKYEAYNKNLSEKIWDEVYRQILDSMLGSNWND